MASSRSGNEAMELPSSGVAALQFLPYEENMEQAVKAFNQRLHAGGRKDLRFPENHLLSLPKLPGCGVYQQGFLLAQHGEVRGAYILKQQKVAIEGKIYSDVACGPQLPISEGIVDPKYGLNGLLLLRHALRQQPFLFVVGIGGRDEPYAKLLSALGWSIFSVPFYFKVLNGRRFTRHVRYLRRGRLQSALLDLIGQSGIAGLGFKAIQVRFPKRNSRFGCEIVDDFGSWADDLWDRCFRSYSFIAHRDSRILASLYPAQDRRFLRVQVTRNGEPIGWAVLLNTAMSGHKYFGDMRVASIVDCLALPDDATDVVRAATYVLESKAPDVIVGNQASRAWCAGLISSGFIRGPSNYLFATSTRLTERLQPVCHSRMRLHLNRGDGDGPIHL